MRRVIGTIVGLVFAVVFVDTFWEAAGTWFPAPMADDVSDTVFRATFVMGMPVKGHAVLAIGWLASAFLGAYAGLRVSQWRPAGWIVGAALVAFAVWNITQLAQPLWLQIVSLVLPLAGVWLAERHFHRARRGDPLLN